MKTYILNDGNSIPALGCGVFEVPADGTTLAASMMDSISSPDILLSSSKRLIVLQSLAIALKSMDLF